jgi:uncharacterized protein
VNLPVKDLNKTIAFFTRLGFAFNPQFTDGNATCIIVGKDIFVMFLVEKFFKTFTNRVICDTAKDAEAIVALSAESREKVDRMISKVIEAGGKESRKPRDYGWMYRRGFQDIDGHLWEIFYMDESAAKKRVKKRPRHECYQCADSFSGERKVTRHRGWQRRFLYFYRVCFQNYFK